MSLANMENVGVAECPACKEEAEISFTRHGGGEYRLNEIGRFCGCHLNQDDTELLIEDAREWVIRNG